MLYTNGFQPFLMLQTPNT